MLRTLCQPETIEAQYGLPNRLCPVWKLMLFSVMTAPVIGLVFFPAFRVSEIIFKGSFLRCQEPFPAAAGNVGEFLIGVGQRLLAPFR